MNWYKISQNIMTFYHGTSSGENNENIESFKRGVNASIAQGYGQGSGFYVWADKNDAIAHSRNFLSGSNGYPMIISVSCPLSPENFDLDHEVMSSVTGQFIFGTWDSVFKRLPEGSIQTEFGVISIADSKKNEGGTMTFFFSRPDGRRKRKSYLPNTESDIGAGQVFGSIFNSIQKNNPQAAVEFEKRAFQQVLSSGARVALKYVGAQTLPVSSIECFINNQWVNASNGIPQQQQPVQQQPVQETGQQPAQPPVQ